MTDYYSDKPLSADGEVLFLPESSRRMAIATAALQGLLASGAYKASPVDFITDKAVQYADSLLNKLTLKK